MKLWVYNILDFIHAVSGLLQVFWTGGLHVNITFFPTALKCIMELDEGFVAFPTVAHIIIISVIIDGLDLLDSHFLANESKNSGCDLSSKNHQQTSKECSK